MIDDIAIIGANLAGGRAAEALRSCGFEGRIHLIGAEPWRPYERPPLSKEVLWAGGDIPDNFFLHDETWYDENRIELNLGVRAEAMDLRDGRVTLASGTSIKADRILLCTGGEARRLPLAGAEASNVHHLRTFEDSQRLAADLRPGARILVIGMGVIGAEVAASARRLGCEVTAIEPFAAPMIRAIGERFGGWLAERHRAQGVTAYYGRAVTRLHLSGSRVTDVELDGGERIACDAVVVGIGIVPAVDLAIGAGLEVGTGIIVDAQCRTSSPLVYAAGDVAEGPGFFGGRARQETYQNASEQGAAAAAAILGHAVDYCRPCWFWSDQYDLNIQFTGQIAPNLPVVVRGNAAEEPFSAFFLSGDQVVGAMTVNRGPDMGVAKRLVERRARVIPGELADTDMSLREILKKCAS